MSTEFKPDVPPALPSPLTPGDIASPPAGASKQERRRLKKERQHEERRRDQRQRAMKKAARIALGILAAGGAIAGLSWWVSTRPYLPPTTTQGHTEDMPPSHISGTPIPDRMQRHMLEHADGSGKPGILVQYNCQDYACEPEIVQKLSDVVAPYPDHVYLAPNRYDGKIILTKLGSMQILDTIDAQRIRKFIE